MMAVVGPRLLVAAKLHFLCTNAAATRRHIATQACTLLSLLGCHETCSLMAALTQLSAQNGAAQSCLKAGPRWHSATG